METGVYHYIVDSNIVITLDHDLSVTIDAGEYQLELIAPPGTGFNTVRNSALFIRDINTDRCLRAFAARTYARGQISFQINNRWYDHTLFREPARAYLKIENDTLQFISPHYLAHDFLPPSDADADFFERALGHHRTLQGLAGRERQFALRV